MALSMLAFVGCSHEEAAPADEAVVEEAMEPAADAAPADEAVVEEAM